MGTEIPEHFCQFEMIALDAIWREYAELDDTLSNKWGFGPRRRDKFRGDDGCWDWGSSEGAAVEARELIDFGRC